MQETVAEINTCSAGNQLQPINGQTNESAQRVAAQLENMKLKMEKLESKCAKKDLEIQNC
jgi:hypothetical protein